MAGRKGLGRSTFVELKRNCAKTLEPSSSQFSIQSSQRRRQVFVKVCPRLGHGIVAGFLFISKVANQMTCDKCGPQGYLCEKQL